MKRVRGSIKDYVILDSQGTFLMLDRLYLYYLNFFNKDLYGALISMPKTGNQIDKINKMPGFDFE